MGISDIYRRGNRWQFTGNSSDEYQWNFSRNRNCGIYSDTCIRDMHRDIIYSDSYSYIHMYSGYNRDSAIQYGHVFGFWRSIVYSSSQWDLSIYISMAI